MMVGSRIVVAKSGFAGEPVNELADIIAAREPPMPKSRKSWREKLASDKGLPKVETIEGHLSKRWGEGTVLIPAPSRSMRS